MGFIKKIRTFFSVTKKKKKKPENQIVWVRASEWRVKDKYDFIVARHYCRYEIIWDNEDNIGKVLFYGHEPQYHPDYSIAINVLNVLNGLIKQPTKYLKYSDLNNFVIEKLSVEDCEKFLNDSLKKEDYYISDLIKNRLKVLKENES